MFSMATIDELRLEEEPDAVMLHAEWSSTAPAASVFQVYLDRKLAWHGTARSVSLPYPGSATLDEVTVHVGVVDAIEGPFDLSAQLPPQAGGGNRALLQWIGGSYLDPTGNRDVQGFRIYGSPAPGAAIDDAKPLDDIPAYVGGKPLDGWGRGGWGQGGWGRAATAYSWTSGRLRSGVWLFAVKPYDKAGNERQPVASASITIVAPPRPVAPNAQRRRLTHTFNAATRVATLNWLPSPG